MSSDTSGEIEVFTHFISVEEIEHIQIKKSTSCTFSSLGESVYPGETKGYN
jgi:hypothetical protein